MSKRIKLLASGANVAPIYWALQQHPELWNVNPERTAHPSSPHHGLDDIYVRYGPPGSRPDVPHVAEWYFAADTLGVKPLCLDVMRAAGGAALGGVLITRIPAGATCRPHVDPGWHARAHDKYAVQITSAPGQAFCFDCERLESRPGDVYWFDNQFTHWVENPTPYERVTMIVCVRKEL